MCFQAQLPDDGSGSLRMWRVRRCGMEEDGENENEGVLMEVERPQAAVFYDRDCYIALYTYHAPTGDQTILYYWMVNISTLHRLSFLGSFTVYYLNLYREQKIKKKLQKQYIL